MIITIKQGFLALIANFILLQFTFSANLVDEDFSSGIPASWTSFGVTATSYSGKSCAGMETNGYLITFSLYKPGTLTFSHRASGNGKTLTVEKSINGTDWVLVGTVSPSSASTWGSSSMTLNETNSSVLIRFTCSSSTIYITDIVITAGAHPVINSSTTSISFSGLYFVGQTSTSENFSITQADLSEGITVTAPSDFQVSLDNANFSGSVNILQGAGETTVYARYNPSSAKGTQTGNVQLTSSGATTVNVNVTATSISAEPTTQGTVVVNNFTGTTARIIVAGGNGTGKILAGKALNHINFTPQDGVFYNTNTDFSSGTAQTDSSMVLYAGTDDTITISDLESGTQYYLKLFSYNAETSNSHNYLLTSPGTADFQTLKVPGIITTPSALSFSYTLINDSSIKSFQLSGKFLTPESGNIAVTAPADFSVSIMDSSGFATTFRRNSIINSALCQVQTVS